MLPFFCYLKFHYWDHGEEKDHYYSGQIYHFRSEKGETKKSDGRWLSQLSRKGSQGLYSLKQSLQVSNGTSKPQQCPQVRLGSTATALQSLQATRNNQRLNIQKAREILSLHFDITVFC